MNESKYLLGLDIGSSSVKASLVDAQTGKLLSSATSPDVEMEIKAVQPGWAEQEPEAWWDNVKRAVAKIGVKYSGELKQTAGIGISYQMHGLVLVDREGKVLRPSIIWCDNRAVPLGEQAADSIGREKSLEHCLNFPGNFTASKLKWVMDNEPDIYSKIYKFMLPGDYIAMRITGEMNTTQSGLSEGILWDFKQNSLAELVLDAFGIDKALIPDIVPTFAVQGTCTPAAAADLGIPVGTPVAYRAGDQPNNAFSLNALNPGDLATTAGTSGVVYAIGDTINYDSRSRVNTFIHVNHSEVVPRLGTLMCLSGTGILNSWLKNNLSRLNPDLNYMLMDEQAAAVPPGSDNLFILPYGNSAERTLENRAPGCSLHNLDFTLHTLDHIYRAAQEGIVFALNYGLEIMRQMGIGLKTVRAGNANMFLSPVFRQAFTNTSGLVIELLNTDGAQGAARGAGVGAGIYGGFEDAFRSLDRILVCEPEDSLQEIYAEKYNLWKEKLVKLLS